MDRQCPKHSPVTDESKSEVVVINVDHHTTTNGSNKGKAAAGRWAETLMVAYKTLGVVFGELVASPLYVYSMMPFKSPIEDDYLGIYSIMFWTLTLIMLVKYATIALRADYHGEGGTFSLY